MPATDSAAAVLPSRDAYDVVVVGGRVAGASTALLLARAGLDVLVVERGRRGGDTLSTLALMRGGVFQLRRWGLLDPLLATAPPPITVTTFHYGETPVRLALRARDGVEALFAPRRKVLDPLLGDAARAAGAEVVHELRVSALERSPRGRVAGVVVEHPRAGRRSIAARWVVGADGADSTVARLAGAPTTRAAASSSFFVYGFFATAAIESLHWHFTPGAAAGHIPTHDGLACVFVGGGERRFGGELRGDLAAGHARLLAEVAPGLARAVADARRDGSLHAFPGRRGFLRRPWGPGWALVGDAGYFKDPITAHGLSDALRDAELLARALRRDSEAALADYEATRDGLSSRLFEITDRLASHEAGLGEIQQLHIELNREMNREVDYLAALPDEPAAYAVN
ncbi:MAG: FAD-dependent monooxygenase [Thermoanaerobaculia bacterium]|nr:FAD-dependent monooxygenase [Thermoanaerobaculia bacterium]